MPDGPKVIVIGIDGGCWDYIDPLLEKGQLFNLQHLIDSGLRGILESTVPAITPPAWSSFITGKNPVKHGVFDWLVRMGDKFLPFSSAHRYGTPFWKYLNRNGLRTGIIGIPMTYPPEKVDGFMIAGFGAPATSRNLTYPPDLLDSLEREYGEYKVTISHQVAAKAGIDGFLDATLKNEAKQTQIALDLAEEYKVDLLAINFMSVDHLNHLSKDYVYVEKTLIGIDQNLGRITKRFPNSNLIVLSDHGSRRLKGLFLLRNWLHEQGLVHYLPRGIKSLTGAEINHVLARWLQDHYGWKGIGEESLRGLLRSLFNALPTWGKRIFLDVLLKIVPYRFVNYQYTDRIDWEKTLFYELAGLGSFYVNINDGNPNDSPGWQTEYEDLQQKLIELLSTLKDPFSGRPFVHRFYKKQETYNGPFIDLAPDLVADVSQSTCAFKVGGFQDNVEKSVLFIEPTNYFGAHIPEGMFVFCGRDLKQAADMVESASITDVPATILHLFGVPIPQDYDGRVLTEYISDKFMAATPVHFQEGDGELTRGTENPFCQEDLESLEERLRGLGYIG